MFTMKAVMKVTGLTRETLQMWLHRGHVKPSREGGGTGVRRGYTAEEVIRIRLIVELVGFGLSIGDASKWAYDITPDSGVHFAWVISLDPHGRLHGYAASNEKDLAESMLRDARFGRPFLVLPLLTLVEKTLEALVALEPKVS